LHTRFLGHNPQGVSGPNTTWIGISIPASGLRIIISSRSFDTPSKKASYSSPKSENFSVTLFLKILFK
jgi:hypothetical protein